MGKKAEHTNRREDFFSITFNKQNRLVTVSFIGHLKIYQNMDTTYKMVRKADLKVMALTVTCFFLVWKE